jgi:UDP-4-amino-4-deoxy-L-arabinose formyltransferase/UDP-glucuronic acid dehydrogenase (UDP-4-keto-hexauronic acid decarboxylating)
VRVAIIGRSEILYDTAERLVAAGYQIALVITAKEAPEYEARVPEFAALAKRLNTPFLRTAHIANTLPEIRSAGPIDVAVSVNFPAIIPDEVIHHFPLGILNAHGGDLPRYRGNACQAWAILNGEERVGLCIHKMIGDALDAGDIIARDYHAVGLQTTVTELWTWMRERAPELFETALQALGRDPTFVLERQSRDPRDSLRCYPRRPDDGRIDWNRSAIEVLRLINASTKPYSGAYCELDGERVIIWDAELAFDDEIYLAVPGQIAAIGTGWAHVITGSGKIKINKVETTSGITTPDRLNLSLRNRFT